jgi:hypothetical protein
MGHHQPESWKGRKMSLQIAANLGSSGDVECSKRLVEQKEARVRRERAGQGHALALTA